MWKVFLTYDKQSNKLFTVWNGNKTFFNDDGGQYTTPYQSEAQELADNLNGDSDE